FLRGLNPTASAALIDGLAGSNPLSTRQRDAIQARADGVPLFVEEITKSVLEAGSLAEQAAVPATLHDSLIARLDGSPTMKAAAQIAACVGRDFDADLLDRIADVPATQLREGLAALIRGGLVLSDGESGYSFKHALIRDVAYETLLTPRRQKLHQRIAEALEALEAVRGGRTPIEPELLARHWFAAGQPARAESYWLRARHRAAHWREQLDALAEYLNVPDTTDGYSPQESIAR